MEETPESLPPDDEGTDEQAPYSTGDKLLAAVLLGAVVALAYVCMDVIAGGRLTRSLAPVSAEDAP